MTKHHAARILIGSRRRLRPRPRRHRRRERRPEQPDQDPGRLRPVERRPVRLHPRRLHPRLRQHRRRLGHRGLARHQPRRHHRPHRQHPRPQRPVLHLLEERRHPRGHPRHRLRRHRQRRHRPGEGRGTLVEGVTLRPGRGPTGSAPRPLHSLAGVRGRGKTWWVMAVSSRPPGGRGWRPGLLGRGRSGVWSGAAGVDAVVAEAVAVPVRRRAAVVAQVAARRVRGRMGRLQRGWGAR